MPQGQEKLEKAEMAVTTRSCCPQEDFFSPFIKFWLVKSNGLHYWHFFQIDLILWHSLPPSGSPSIFMISHIWGQTSVELSWVYLILLHAITPSFTQFPGNGMLSFFLTIHKTLLHIFAAFSFSLHVLMNAQTHSISWLFWTAPQ